MKKTFLLLLLPLLLFGCSDDSGGSASSSKYNELYRITDYFVEQLYTVYDSYGITGEKYKKYTKDNEYRVLPIGRLVSVRIEHVATDEEYEDLRYALASHYVDDYRVNQVYISQGGIVMIDCRK